MLEQRLYVNATFYTQWSRQATASALLVRGERILAIGTPEELRPHITGAVSTIDLERSTVIPGLTDSHIHTGNFARETAALDLRGTRSIDHALERIRAYAETLPADAWILGGRWDFNAWEHPIQPDRHVLDSVTGGRLAALPSIDGHTLWANTLALAAAGIDAHTHDPIGGEIVRSADGIPTGILRENARNALIGLSQGFVGADFNSQLAEAQRRLLAVGLTGVHDFDGEDVLAGFQDFRTDGELHIRVHKAIPMAALDQAISCGKTTGDGDAWLRTGPVKLFSDGALGSHTCHMNEAFPGGEDNTGIEVLPYHDLLTLVRRAAGAGIAVATHAIGDRANQMVLDAYQDLITSPLNSATSDHELPSRLRHRIEHAQHLCPSDVQRMADLGVVPSMQPTHCTTDAPLASTLLAERNLASYAWRSLIDAGAHPAFGSDCPVELPNPLHGIHAAVTRQDPMGKPDNGWQPSERISVAEAIAAYTVGAAYASGEESHKGRLRPGMLADFTVLGADPYLVTPSELRNVPVVATAVGGAIRHHTHG